MRTSAKNMGFFCELGLLTVKGQLCTDLDFLCSVSGVLVDAALGGIWSAR